MKAERRHDLKTNTLARALENLPETARQYGSRLLLGLLAVLLVIILIRYRMSASDERQQKAVQDLAVARNDLSMLKLSRPNDPAQFDKYKEIAGRLDTVIANTDGSNGKAAAEALVTRGDLNWNMANMASSTTRPSEGEPSPADLLKSAEEAYAEVVSKYPQEYFSAASAHLGLAAIDENRREWEKARKEYQAVIDNSHIFPVIQQLAQRRLQLVDQLELPVIIGEVNPGSATEPALPDVVTTLPVGPTTLQLGPFLSPATTTMPLGTIMPSTSPVGPLTRPGSTTLPLETVLPMTLPSVILRETPKTFPLLPATPSPAISPSTAPSLPNPFPSLPQYDDHPKTPHR